MPKTASRIACCAVATLVLSTCGDDPTSSSLAQVQILLTDAPSDYIGSAEVWISRVYLMPGGDMDDATEGTEEEDETQGPPWVDLFNDSDNPLHYDLLTLRDGLAADLTGLADVPEGMYGRLRLVVQDAKVTLADGYEFREGGNEAPLKVPSGYKSGLKVKLAEVITAEAGTTTIVTVDFDVDQNFKLQGNPDSQAGIRGVLFTPNLKELKRDETDEASTT